MRSHCSTIAARSRAGLETHKLSMQSLVSMKPLSLVSRPFWSGFFLRRAMPARVLSRTPPSPIKFASFVFGDAGLEEVFLLRHVYDLAHPGVGVVFVVLTLKAD